jgi:hypothetical protein
MKNIKYEIAYYFFWINVIDIFDENFKYTNINIADYLDSKLLYKIREELLIFKFNIVVI